MKPETKQQNNTSQTCSPDEISHFASAKQAEIHAYNDAKIYLSTYTKILEELKNRGKINYWQDELNQTETIDTSAYIPDKSDTLERFQNLQKLVAPHTALHLLPGDF